MLLRIYLVVTGCFFTCVIAPVKNFAREVRDTGFTQRFPALKIPAQVLDSVSCIIPFTRAGNLIIVKAQADTSSGNFILDTGAPGLVLNITYFRDYPTTLITDAEHSGITGSLPFVNQAELKTFSFGALNYFKINADLTNLGNIENSKGIKILGLLGVSLFKDCELIIDYATNLIYIHRITRKEASTYQNEMLRDVAAYNIIPMDLTDDRIIVEAQAAGKNLKFAIDCAAESNILDSRLPDKIFNNVTVIRRVLLDGIGGKKVEALYGDLMSIKIGDQSITNLPFLITNLKYTCFALNGCVDGVLGFDFLGAHRIGFNFVKRKMYIWK